MAGTQPLDLLHRTLQYKLKKCTSTNLYETLSWWGSQILGKIQVCWVLLQGVKRCISGKHRCFVLFPSMYFISLPFNLYLVSSKPSQFLDLYLCLTFFRSLMKVLVFLSPSLCLVLTVPVLAPILRTSSLSSMFSVLVPVPVPVFSSRFIVLSCLPCISYSFWFKVLPLACRWALKAKERQTCFQFWSTSKLRLLEKRESLAFDGNNLLSGAFKCVREISWWERHVPSEPIHFCCFLKMPVIEIALKTDSEILRGGVRDVAYL